MDNLGQLEHFIKYYYSCRIGQTDFIVYELADKSLGKALYEMKGEFYNGERVYKINLTDYYWDFIKPNNIKTFIREMATAIDQLMSCDNKKT
jgi:hypothetical protein